MSSNVDQIKSKIDIVSLVGSYIKLEKAGGNFKGRCPFHNEKTPSFFVSPDRGSYYCFGCQAKGDIFTFVQEFEGLDFIGSLKVLADRAGVVLDHTNVSAKTEKEKLHSILEQAVFFYQKKLDQNKDAMSYLVGRGITEETIKSFRLGFAPLLWRELFDFLTSKGASPKDMLEVGLIKKKDDTSSGQNSSYYDTFRGRIMFPISDSSGRVVGFSGRILVDDEKSPKYLNSPETSLFNKSEILFGMDKAKKDIRIKDYSVLVEGQMDLVMLHQAGITNTVASSGTALTAEHLTKLRRLSNRIIMIFDGDSAGFKASNRSAHLALSLGMELKLVLMPEGKDPADMAKENKEELVELLKNALHIIDFYTESLVAKGLDPRNLNFDLNTEIRQQVLPYVALLPNQTDKAHYIKSIMRKTFLNEEALWDDLKKIGNSHVDTVPKNPILPSISRIGSIERKLAGIILWQEGSQTPTIDFLDLKEKMKSVVGDRISELIGGFENDKDYLLFETESYYNNKNDLETEVSELLINFEEEYLKKEFTHKMLELQKAEQTRDSSLILKYLEECQNISQKINALKSKK